MRFLESDESFKGQKGVSKSTSVAWLWTLGVAVLLLVTPRAHAQGRLSDGPEGVSCNFFSTAGRLAWTKPGGDWIDASSEPHGDHPFSSAPASVVAGQVTELDLAALLAAIHTREQTFGGLLLRYLGRGGTVAFHARESADMSSRPSLKIRLNDGSTTTLSPVADSVLDCSTLRALGGGAAFKLSSSQSAFIEFDLSGVDLSRVVSATLSLTAQRVWSTLTGEIGVFLATLPGADRAQDAMPIGIASGFARDRNIQSHPAVFFATGFEDKAISSGWSQMFRKSQAVLVDSADENGFVPLQGNALKVSLIPQQNLGLDLRYDFAKELGEEPSAAYLRYYLMFGKNWKPDVDGGKLPGFAGTYNQGGWGQRRSDGTNGWSVRGAFARQAPSNYLKPQPLAIGSYAYHADTEGRSGAFWGWNLGPTGLLDAGRWYAIEQHVRMNTPGKNDGEFRAWIDGQLVFERTDLRFRDIDTLKIETAWFNVYHGGTAKPAREMSLYIDNVVIASEYIGPMSK